MKYSELLRGYIKKSGKTLEQIAEECEAMGVKVHPTYISKLRLGKRPAPSEEITIVLAKVLGVDPDRLLLASYFEKWTDLAPDHLRNQVRFVYGDLDDLFDFVDKFKSVDDALNAVLKAFVYMEMADGTIDEETRKFIEKMVGDIIIDQNIDPEKLINILVNSLNKRSKFIILMHVIMLSRTSGEKTFDFVNRIFEQIEEIKKHGHPKEFIDPVAIRFDKLLSGMLDLLDDEHRKPEISLEKITELVKKTRLTVDKKPLPDFQTKPLVAYLESLIDEMKGREEIFN